MDLEATLTQRFRSSAAGDVDVVVALATDAGERLTTFSVRQGVLCFDHGAAPDATLFFDAAETALGIFSGSTDPMAAFMARAFRADGNLPLVFVLLGLFRGDFGAAPPE